MIEEKPWNNTPEKGITRRFFYNHADDTFTIQTQQTVSVAPGNRYFYNQFDERARWKDEGEVVARIPDPILLRLQEQGLLDDKIAFLKWLDHPDQRVFRTRPGRLYIRARPGEKVQVKAKANG